MLIVIWFIALTGIIKKIFFFDRIFKYTIWFYIAMGWSIAFNTKTLLNRINKKGIQWLVSGGIMYTLATIFFTLGKTKKYCHAIFHIMIAAGSACHYINILKYNY